MNDHSMVTAPDALRAERLLPGPIERVWAYLTESDKRAQWFAAGEMDLRVGGRVEHVFRNARLSAPDDPPPARYARDGAEAHMQGRVLACEPPRLLSFVWNDGPGEGSEITFELSKRAGKVLLVVTHRRLGAHDLLVNVAAGWHTHLTILVDRLEGREPPSFWAMHTRLAAEYRQRIPAPAHDDRP